MAFCNVLGCRVDDVNYFLFCPIASSTANNATQIAIKTLGSRLDVSGWLLQCFWMPGRRREVHNFVSRVIEHRWRRHVDVTQYNGVEIDGAGLLLISYLVWYRRLQKWWVVYRNPKSLPFLHCFLCDVISSTLSYCDKGFFMLVKMHECFQNRRYIQRKPWICKVSLDSVLFPKTLCLFIVVYDWLFLQRIH